MLRKRVKVRKRRIAHDSRSRPAHPPREKTRRFLKIGFLFSHLQMGIWISEEWLVLQEGTAKGRQAVLSMRERAERREEEKEGGCRWCGEGEGEGRWMGAWWRVDQAGRVEFRVAEIHCDRCWEKGLRVEWWLWKEAKYLMEEGDWVRIMGGDEGARRIRYRVQWVPRPGEPRGVNWGWDDFLQMVNSPWSPKAQGRIAGQLEIPWRG